MNKIVIIDHVVLVFKGAPNLGRKTTQELRRRLKRADWTKRLRPLLEGIPAEITVVDDSGGEPREACPRNKGRSGDFCVEVVRVGWATRTFEFSGITPERAAERALAEAGNHEFVEKDAEYEVQAVYPKARQKTDQR